MGLHQKFLIDAREAQRYGRAMTTPPETALLRARIQELEHLNTDLTRQVADLERHNKELREAVAALLAPGCGDRNQRTG